MHVGVLRRILADRSPAGPEASGPLRVAANDQEVTLKRAVANDDRVTDAGPNVTIEPNAMRHVLILPLEFPDLRGGRVLNPALFTLDEHPIQLTLTAVLIL